MERSYFCIDEKISILIKSNIIKAERLAIGTVTIQLAIIWCPEPNNSRACKYQPKPAQEKWYMCTFETN